MFYLIFQFCTLVKLVALDGNPAIEHINILFMDALNDWATPIIEDIETSDGCFMLTLKFLLFLVLQSTRTLDAHQFLSSPIFAPLLSP